MSADLVLLAFDEENRALVESVLSVDMWTTDMDGDRRHYGDQMSEPDEFGVCTVTQAPDITFRIASLDANLFDRVYSSTDVNRKWIGQVSWLKGALMPEHWERYVPGPVLGVQRLLEDGPRVIDDLFITQVMVAMNAPNRSIYTHKIRYFWVPEYKKCSTKYKRGNWLESGVERRQRVKRWLVVNKGRLVMSASE